MKKIITNTIKQQIIKFYTSKPITIDECAKHFNYSNPTIGKILKEANCTIWTKTQLFSPNLLEDYFENIDTEEKAYYLGLIITDGCINSNKGQNTLCLGLQEVDKYLVEQFKAELGTNRQLTVDNRSNNTYYSVQIKSNKLVNDLIKYGVSFQKSLNTIFPTNLNNNLYNHLIRGIIDGDGSIAFYNRKNRHVHSKSLRICSGTKQFLNDIMIFLHNTLNITIRPILQYKENTWVLAYNQTDDLVKLYNYLYNNVHIYMKRKKEVFDKIIEEINYYHDNTEITTNLTN